MRDQKKWTVFFLMKAIGPSTKEAIKLLNEIRDIDFGEEISIVLCINLYKKNLPAVLAGVPDAIIDGGDKSETTVFYFLAPDAERSSGFFNNLNRIDEKEDFDITEPEHIKVFFKENVLGKFQADRYMLFTWDHGNGYGIFSDPPPVATLFFNIRKHLLFMDNDRLTRIPNVISNKKNDGFRSKNLTMDELSTAIQSAFGDQKIDLLIMMNCFMQFFDTGYALRNTVKYLVAPETYMDCDGYNYSFFFRRLREDVNQSSRKLVDTIINSFETKLYVDSAEGTLARSGTALFATDLSYYSLLADHIDRLAEALSRGLKSRSPEIIMARSITIPVNAATFAVDLVSLLSNLRKTLGYDWEYNLIEEMLEVHGKVVIEKFIGSDYSNGKESSHPSGVSIFFPIRLTDIFDGERARQFQDTSFTIERKWNNFVMHFTKRSFDRLSVA